MRIWITKNSEVSVREQIVTQIRLGIASRDLLPGEKLPSTRELARRFGIHANTVSAAFRELAREGLVVFRKGSGVFVSAGDDVDGAEMNIDSLVADFAAGASSLGYTRSQIEIAMRHWLAKDGGPRIVVVESDPGLRSIILEEVSSGLGRPAEAIGSAEFTADGFGKTAIFVALFDEKEKLQSRLGPGQRSMFMEVNSVPSLLSGADKPARDELIAVVSCWDQFLALARMYLLAARIDPEMLIVRSTREPDWKKGLDSASIVICDSFTAAGFGDDSRVRVFRLLNEESIRKLKHVTI